MRGRFYAGGTTGTRIEFTILGVLKADAPVTSGHPMPPSRYCHSSFNSNNSGVYSARGTSEREERRREIRTKRET